MPLFKNTHYSIRLKEKALRTLKRTKTKNASKSNCTPSWPEKFYPYLQLLVRLLLIIILFLFLVNFGMFTFSSLNLNNPFTTAETLTTAKEMGLSAELTDTLNNLINAEVIMLNLAFTIMI